MGRTASRLYLPLDIGFMDEDKVIEAGEQAGWLFVAMMLRCKMLASDGVISTPQIVKLAIPGWQKRLSRCVDVGLVIELPDGRYAIPSWEKWNETQAQIEVRRKRDRDRKAAENP